ncbi:hypothetical protein [Desulforamulus hydrothermalis]|uniref:Outer membrane protein-like protein n=1 Tax=Desulforamulus hydrothermalis Lam5 = DSM 18033 TaxID=1121428 RepID=K8EHQ4_9FIRM|nr:hypothetical protein [Desulforamulus hydrothermalis]CCO08166.1 Outer membrane protein-like protein [Desulforamulus hydrothermalis Lam5 = DSM 18033]SHH23377.1 hypothetical protein SAMN02745177_01916 [Desulforamulus hydrothermalis Lam5 = DSM 18033]
MQKTLIILLSLLFVLQGLPASAATDAGSTPTVLTLEQARALALANSRELQKYETAADRAKYQKQQTADQTDDAYDRYNSLSNQYSSLSEQYDQLLADGDTAGAAAIKAKLEQIEEAMETQYDKIAAASGDEEDAADNYEDAMQEAAKYRKKLAYLVEELYTTILSQEAALAALEKECYLKQQLLMQARQKLVLGSSTQLAADQAAAELIDLQKSISEQAGQIKINKGMLNDMIGRNFSDELTLTPFEVPGTFELPAEDMLLSDAAQSYDRLWQLARDINNLEDDLDEAEDYYRSLLLRQDIKTKELELADAKVNLAKTVNSLLAQMQARQQAYQLAVANFVTAQNTYRWDQKKYELGQISKMTLQASELNFLKTKNKKEAAGYDLYLARRSLELAQAGVL